jgi:hypothetical protein
MMAPKTAALVARLRANREFIGPRKRSQIIEIDPDSVKGGFDFDGVPARIADLRARSNAEYAEWRREWERKEVERERAWLCRLGVSVLDGGKDGALERKRPIEVHQGRRRSRHCRIPEGWPRCAQRAHRQDDRRHRRQHRAARSSQRRTCRRVGEAMMRNRLPKHVHGFIDHDGRPRFYLRLKGQPGIPLPGLPWSPTFMRVYDEAMAAAVPITKSIGANKIIPRSLRALAVSYYDSAAFAALKPNTRKVYRSIIDLLCRETDQDGLPGRRQERGRHEGEAR